MENRNVLVFEDDASDDDLYDDSSSISEEDVTCPLTLEIFKYPVKLRSSGKVFEKEAIEEWINTRGGRAINPLNPGEMITINDLISAPEMRKKVAAYKLQIKSTNLPAKEAQSVFHAAISNEVNHILSRFYQLNDDIRTLSISHLHELSQHPLYDFYKRQYTEMFNTLDRMGQESPSQREISPVINNNPRPKIINPSSFYYQGNQQIQSKPSNGELTMATMIVRHISNGKVVKSYPLIDPAKDGRSGSSIPSPDKVTNNWSSLHYQGNKSQSNSTNDYYGQPRPRIR